MRLTRGRWMAFGAPFLAALLAWPLSAGAADVGGGFWAVLGSGKVTAARPGPGPVKFDCNLRLAFDGAPEDATGTGTLLVFDETGQFLLHEIPFDWTAGKGKSYKIVPSAPEMGVYLKQRLDAGSGSSSVVLIESIEGKGAIRRRGEAASLKLQATGQVSFEGEPPRKLKATLNGK